LRLIGRGKRERVRAERFSPLLFNIPDMNF
jgi:hypothetical protein